jgi:hypothetical protein
MDLAPPARPAVNSIDVVGMRRTAGLTTAVLAAVAILASQGVSFAQDRECGTSPNDWCPAPAGDPCGRHRNANECRNDASCNAVPFRGATKIACITDRRGFSLNCPTVGCRSSTSGK